MPGRNSGQRSKRYYKMRSIENILLIQPPYTIRSGVSKNCQIPLGLAYLASTLSNRFRVGIIDAIVEGYEIEEVVGNSIRYGLPFREIQKRIRAFSPDVIGISCLFSTQWENVRLLARAIREVNKDMVVIAGGAHPSAVPEDVLSNRDIDYAIIGEGEEALGKLIDALYRGNDVCKIEGVASRNGKRIFCEARTHFINDLDTIPYPAWSHLPMGKYFSINMPHGGGRYKPNIVMITSRGCPYRCVFCSIHTVWGRRFRARSVPNIIGEMELLIERYGIKEIQFEDDNLLFDRDRAERLFEAMIEKKLGLHWTAPNGISVERLDINLLKKMKDSGCYTLFLAIESGSEDTLKDIIRKRVPLKRIRDLVRKARGIGIDTFGFFVVGLPGETRSRIRETFSFASTIQLNGALFFYATPYPGTDLYTQALNQNIIRGIHYSDLCIERPVMGTGVLSRDMLERFVEREKKIYRIRSILYGWIKDPLYHIFHFITHPIMAIRRLVDYIK